MSEGDAGREPEFEFEVDPMARAGVWATSARVTRTKDEFAIDFIRVDPFEPTIGVLVARVAMSPLSMRELLDALDENGAGTLRRLCPRRSRMSDDLSRKKIRYVDAKPTRVRVRRSELIDADSPRSAEAERLMRAHVAKELRKRKR